MSEQAFEEITRRCYCCKEVLPLSAFNRASKEKHGRCYQCRECQRMRVSGYQQTKGGKTKRKQWRGTPGAKEYDKKYRQKWRKENPEKCKVHNTIDNAKRSRKLIPEPCEVCGTEKAHAHHDDYTKPFDIRWLCPLHHMRVHYGRI